MKARERAPTAAVCAAVDARDEERCFRCLVPVRGGSRHHRQLRRFGDHSPANLLLLCGSGTTGCHGWVHAHPAEAYRHGWLVHGWDTPAAVPVLGDRGRRWWVLTTEGGKTMVGNDDARRVLSDLGLG